MIPLIRSTFYKEKKTKERLAAFITHATHLSFGSQCEQFEIEFAAWQKRAYCVLFNSGSSANLALIQSLLNLNLLQKKDAVGFSAVGWSTNVMPLIQHDLTPIPIDPEIDTLNVSSRKLAGILRKYPLKAVFLTDLLGFCDDVDIIANMCHKHHILLLEDTCESLGSQYKKKLLGNYSFASTFSFYVGHHMSTIEGGAVVTDNTDLATMLQIVRAHGWDRNTPVAKQEELRSVYNINSSFYSRYTFYDLGYNLRPTEITGFLGRDQLTFVPLIIKKRQDNFLRIVDSINGLPLLYYPIRYNHMDTISNFAFPIIARSVGIRDQLVALCAGKIEIRPIVGGDLTKQPFFKKYVQNVRYDCPNASIIQTCGLYMGNNPELTKKELHLMISILKSPQK